MDDEHIQFDFKGALARAGYREQRFDCCDTCRFHANWYEGDMYCKLHVDFIGSKTKHVHFVFVNWNGICKHYRPVKDKYRLKGIASKSLNDIRDKVRWE
ncbi:MAG: hypothetical protein Q6373_017060 [Candidatus Sigynarchaeota archaeon]